MKQPGRNLSNTQTKNSPRTVKQSSGDSSRGARMDPPKGFQNPGKNLSRTQTRNSPKVC